MQTSYPVFESGQVLTSRHLNDLVAYLEEQDRFTRNKLIGIGIACGLDVSYESQPRHIRISQGCAVTSDGHLIVQDASVLDRFREYDLPVSRVDESPDDQAEEARYSFFFRDNEQIPLWELFTVDYDTGPGEVEPAPLDEGFLEDKVVALFLECNLESLKNCDINDCSDKGSEREFTLRRLLLRRTDAQRILEQEREIAGRPVDRHHHPAFDLRELHIEKINPAANDIDTFSELLFRIIRIVRALQPNLVAALRSSYTAYRYLLGDMYPTSRFPNGPFGGNSYFQNVMDNFGRNILFVQYLYDFFYDMVQSYNEFLRAAICIESECCPHPDRFPKHVFLGVALRLRPTAFAPDAASLTAVGFDPLRAEVGLKPATRPAEFRHHFIPSPIYDRGCEPLRAVRSLHYRMYLLAFRFATGELSKSGIRITPSKDGDFTLSDKAIPFYYAFRTGDDLHHNWSFEKTIHNRLEQVFSYQFVNPNEHPLSFRLEDHNFYRVEGIVGKPLGQVMRELVEQKRRLGLSFGIEPVNIGLNVKDDPTSKQPNDESRSLSQQAINRLLVCRMRDLDVVFLIAMAAMFYYLYSIITLLSRIRTTTWVRVTGTTRSATTGLADFGIGTTPTSLGSVPGNHIRLDLDRKYADSILNSIRPINYDKGLLTTTATPVENPRDSIGLFYSSIKDTVSTANLFDRTLDIIGQIEPQADAHELAQKIYPAVSLLDKTEELISVVSAPSLGEFNFEQFQTKYDAFVQAFDTFKNVAATLPSRDDPELARTNEALAATFGAIAATGPQTIINNLARELQTRLRAFFEQLVMEGYSQRHPGMQHKGGVNQGGTLVLLYTHKRLAAQVLHQNLDKLDDKYKAVYTSYLPTANPIGVTSPLELLGESPQRADSLDDFVVLADFCLPYMCCDTDCSDVELGKPKQPRANPFTPNPTDPIRIDPTRPIDPSRPIEPLHPIDPRGPLGPIDPIGPIGPIRPDPQPPISTPQPTAPVLQPTGPILQPTSPVLQPIGPIVQPSGPTTQPTGPVLQPTSPVIQPGGPTTQPTGPVLQPTGPVLQPTGPVLQPTGPVLQPTGPVLQPTGPILQPTSPTPTPIVLPTRPVLQPGPATPQPSGPAPIAPTPDSIAIAGTAFGEPTRGGGRVSVLPSVKIQIVDLATNKEVPIRVVDGEFLFKAPPGNYRIRAEASNLFEPLEEILTIQPGMSSTHDLILKRR